MHVHQHQAGLVLREDVDAVQLREGVAEGRGFFGRRQRHCVRGRHEGLIDLRGLREPNAGTLPQPAPDPQLA